MAGKENLPVFSKDILRVLPHRYPMLLIDRIIKIIPGKSIIALKNVTINEPFFQGHFPENPVMPGVLIMEAISQAAAYLALQLIDNKNKLVYFTGIDKAHFKKPVIPGDQMIIEVEILQKRSNMIRFKSVVKVDNTIVTEAEIMGTVN